MLKLFKRERSYRISVLIETYESIELTKIFNNYNIYFISNQTNKDRIRLYDIIGRNERDLKIIKHILGNRKYTILESKGTL